MLTSGYVLRRDLQGSAHRHVYHVYKECKPIQQIDDWNGKGLSSIGRAEMLQFRESNRSPVTWRVINTQSAGRASYREEGVVQEQERK